jgi:hypothetical protein
MPDFQRLTRLIVKHALVTRVVPWNEKEHTYDGTSTAGVNFGETEVTIPEKHRTGKIERPPWWAPMAGEDPARHMVLNRVTQLGETRFQETLAQFESFASSDVCMRPQNGDSGSSFTTWIAFETIAATRTFGSSASQFNSAISVCSHAEEIPCLERLQRDWRPRHRLAGRQSPPNYSQRSDPLDRS